MLVSIFLKERNYYMRIFTFKGGIHPNDGKILSKDKAIQTILPTGDLIFPLSQHIGAPAKPIVEVGDYVLKGQKIAEANGVMSAPVYSSVSGTVKAIEKHFNPTGTKVDCIIVENDSEFKEVERAQVKPLEQLTKEEILNMIGDAGIVGLGGAGFPTKVKLSPKNPEEIKYIIANGAECEPYITADYRCMLEQPELLVSGMKVVLQVFEQAKGIIAIEDNKKDCIEKICELIKDEPRIEVKALKAKYPQGSERQMIYATTGKAIDSTKLPADAGCIVDNVETLMAIHSAVIEGKPLTERIVTVSGNGVTEPSNFRVLLGTNQQELIEAAGGLNGEPEKIISGGPMMGFAMFTVDTPITKTSSSLLCLKKDVVAEHETSACIQCGRCVTVCPSRIVPARLADYAERYDEEEFVKWNGMECIECGCCSYKCPAKRQLKQSIATMKKMVIRNRRQREN